MSWFLMWLCLRNSQNVLGNVQQEMCEKCCSSADRLRARNINIFYWSADQLLARNIYFPLKLPRWIPLMGSDNELVSDVIMLEEFTKCAGECTAGNVREML
jgi:hypothetical protein